MDRINEIIDEMSLDELCGQLLCYEVSLDMDEKKFASFEQVVIETKPGGMFINYGTGEQIKKYTEMINKHTKVPVIVSGDTEHGPNSLTNCSTILPDAMAWGACDDEKLIEEGGKITAQICRKNGMHWSFSPVVDILFNQHSPTGTRAISDSPTQVVKIAGAYLRGLQKEGYKAASCKHFPGEGLDDRNAHFCTTVNPLSREKWMDTYGYVYKEMFKENPGSIMVGHTALPAFQSENEYDDIMGYKPATISYDIITKLLREELGYDGCVVSDALSMVGVAAYIPEEALPVEFIKAGGDMALFAEPSYFTYIKNAVLDGTISMDRLKQSVRRILKLKESVGLLDSKDIEVEVTGDIEKIAIEIAEKSIKIVRNTDNVIPVDVKEGDHVLICNLFCIDKVDNTIYDGLEHIKNAFNKRGIETTVLINPLHREVERVINEKQPTCVLVNSRHSYNDSSGNSMHITWDNIMTFWRGLIFKHPKVVFSSLGDPYKLYELPFLKTYINTFSTTKESQEALVKVILGEIDAKGKNPVEFDGYFKREVFPEVQNESK